MLTFHFPVSPHLGIVTNPSQQAVRDPGSTARPARDLCGGYILQLHPQLHSRHRDDACQICGVVELQLRGKTEPIPQRPRQQARPGCCSNQGKGGQIYWDGSRPWSFADYNIDTEVLHGKVEHLLGGAGESVDLVKEQDITLVEA